jgi:N-acyl-D-amino-acid deacylase
MSRNMLARRLSPVALFLAACGGGPTYDVLIKGGTVYDGSGQPGAADVAITDTVAAIGAWPRQGQTTIDATGWR